VERGIDSSRSTLFVLDGAKVLRRAVLDVFGKRALVQRCQVHKRRNVREHLPEEKRPGVETILKEAFRAATSKTAKGLLEALAGRLAADYPSAAQSLGEGLDELFENRSCRKGSSGTGKGCLKTRAWRSFPVMAEVRMPVRKCPQALR